MERGESWWHELRARWRVQTMYQRFETLVALVLTGLVGLVILVALVRLSVSVVGSLLLQAWNPLDHRVFQTVFGDILTLLIALEFNHTVLYVVRRQESIVQARVVLWIALLALARKFIVLDIAATTPQQMFGLAAMTLALGCVLWLGAKSEPPTRPDV
ncbi:MAG: hypothetical protein KatS3mg077_2138 [Candidatus Binatia bacterium]|nr:MAG: hypothetical protein KatS3mg015_3077 [Fimbriimonadales bacterium]GIW44856.1 MAG: hypothetical protein KatS3mg077_2138 [Candidatus Binatia bacterium]